MQLSHIDQTGAATMVDVSSKGIVKRTAVASATISMKPETITLLQENLLKKGDALACARIAGITAAKKTSDLIPLCHNLPLDVVSVEFTIEVSQITIRAIAACAGRTGVEMEALVAVSVAALTLYDMCKAVDKEMVIDRVHLVEKRKEPVQ